MARIKYGIGARISNCREDMDKSLQDVADAIGVKKNTISRWECGETTPNAKDIGALSKLFNVSCDFLITGTETENKALSEELGLSSDSIKRLKSKQSKAFGIEAKAINLLLSPPYRGLLSSIYNYLYPNYYEPYINTTKGLKQVFPPMSFPPLIPVEKETIAYSIGDTIDTLFESNEPKEILDNAMLIKLMNEMSKTKKRIYEKSAHTHMTSELENDSDEESKR